MIHAQVHLGFLQNSTSSNRSCTQNTGPTYPISPSQSHSHTFVTKRRKLFDTNGRLSASLCVLSSLGRPDPPPLPAAFGSLGKFGGRRDPRRRSDTLEETEEAVGTENLRMMVGGMEVSGKEGMDVRAREMGRCGEVEVVMDGAGMRMADWGREI